MHDPVAAIAAHGYAILALFIFAEAAGLPMPASLAMLAAGAASAHGAMNTATALAVSVGAMLAGDTLLYLMGRYTGWWLLGLLCRVSANPESCILRSADSFYRHGRTTLVFAKFIPGLNSLAPPLAGSMHMRAAQFLRLDLLAALLYISVYFWTGYLFSGLITRVAMFLNSAGRFVAAVVVFALVVYLLYQVRAYLKTRAYRGIVYISAEALRKRMEESGKGFVIADVRSHGYYDRGAHRIHGSVRIEPHRLPVGLESLDRDCDIFLYCSCARQATSLRVARVLGDMGYRAVVLKGGLRGWNRLRYPLEPVPAEDVVLLPSFD